MEIVQVNHNKARADSLHIAENFNKRHDNVIRAVEKAIKDTNSLLKIEVSKYTDERGKAQKMYLLDRDAFSFIVMSFTGKEATTWKLKYIEAFNKMEALIKEKKSDEYQFTRNNAKVLRRFETDAIAEFILYAQKSGSSNADMYYKHFTELVNKTAGINDCERDALTPQLLFVVGTIEAKVTEIILEMIEKTLYYKDIYKIVKQQLEMLASFLPKHEEKYLPSPQKKSQMQISFHTKELICS